MARILLADPSPHAQRMGGQILREEGYTVETATSGAEALLKAHQLDPEVVIADVQLPGESGYDLARKLPESAVILSVGARSAPPDAAKAEEAGCRAIVSKPFEATVLLELVARAVAEVKAARAKTRTKAGAAAGSGELDRECVEAAVTLALESALPSMIQEITERVLIALRK